MYETTDEDMKKLLSLVREYTEKLRDICEYYNAAKYKRAQLWIAAVLTMALMLVTAFLVIPSIESRAIFFSERFVAVIAAFIASAGVAAALFSTERTRKTAYDVHQLAATVERLIRTASQYGEHASNRIADRFEYDLRLAEADAALKVYHDLFSVRGGGIG